MRMLRRWLNRKRKSRRFRMYQLSPCLEVSQIQPDIQVISVAR